MKNEKITTRSRLLKATFEEVYQNGYSGTTIKQILKSAGGVNKGSMYYYFESKKDMMLKTIFEIIIPMINNKFTPISKVDKNVMDTLFFSLKNSNSFNFIKGSPTNNLIQELSPIDKDFKDALEKTYFVFTSKIEDIVERAVERDGFKVKDTKSFAAFIVACIEGGLSSSKKSQDDSFYNNTIKELEKITKNYY